MSGLRVGCERGDGGTVGVEQVEPLAIIFCLTSRIFSCRQTLFGNISTCLLWNDAVAWLDGNNPSSWNNSRTSCLRLSRVLRSDAGLLSLVDIPAVLGVAGEFAGISEFPESKEVLNTSGLKSGPKNVVPVTLDDPVCGVLGVLGVALASEPISSSAKDSFLFRSLKL